MTPAARCALTVFAAVILAQAAWILALPPYRGIDEFDHVYRASGVATGQWRLSEVTEDGRGHLVVVPRGVVEAASAQCDSLPYTEPGNCFPVRELADGRVTVSSAASSYNPAFYALIGYPTKQLDGAALDYGLRAASALLCAVGIAAAVWALLLTRAGTWVRVGLLTALTPVLLYTTILPAPNGLEIVAGLCLWASLLSLGSKSPTTRTRYGLWVIAATAGAVLGTTRTLGPAWVLLIAAAALAYVGPKRGLFLAARTPVAMTLAALVVAAASLAGAWWTVSAGLTAPVDLEPRSVGDSHTQSATTTWTARAILWTVQLIAAFPFRDQPAPTAVYALFLVSMAVVLALGLRRAATSRRLLLTAGVVLVVLGPLALTAATSAAQGVIWQGRYGLPFAVGVLILAGDAADGYRRDSGPPVVWPVCVLAATGLAQVISVWDVARDESRRSVSAADSSWVTLPAPLIGLLMACAVTVAAAGALSTRGRTTTGAS